MSTFDNLSAVVTGGASGIGATIATSLMRAGAKVAVLDVALGEGVPAGALAIEADIRNDASVRAAIETVASTHGGIDIVINNAGVGAQGTIETASDEEWERVLDINVVGMARVARACLPYLRDSSHAAVVNVGSIAATVGLEQRAVYSASKGAVVALTRAMAVDHLQDGVRVNCVSPGTANTPWINRLLANAENPEAELIQLQERQPHGRLVEMDEIAEAVLYLASPNATSTTGVCLAVDGGMDSLRPRKVKAVGARTNS